MPPLEITYTTVDLTDADAKKFLLFQKYYDLFAILDAKKALDIGFGKVIINIAWGEVQNVVKEEVVYKK
jgi:3'-phosphoadenosine 5'-phosphosulfate (PAPS) 3'-phosphatase